MSDEKHITELTEMTSTSGDDLVHVVNDPGGSPVNKKVTLTNLLPATVAGDGLSGGGGSALSVNVDDSTIEINSDNLRVKDAGITASKIASAVAGNGLAGGGGSALSVNVDDSTIEINSDSLRVKDDGITYAKLADPYDILYYSVIPADEGLETGDGQGYFFITDVHDGMDVVKVKACLTGSTGSGTTTVTLRNYTDSHDIATMSISSGQRTGVDTSFTYPSLAEDDLLRVDIDAVGSGAEGLDIWIKVEKA